MSCGKKLELSERILTSAVVELLTNVDLPKLSIEFFRNRVISKGVYNSFAALDHDRLDGDVKVRYLLQRVCEAIDEDERVYERVLRVLSRFGKEAKIMSELLRKQGLAEREKGVTLYTEQDFPMLVEKLAPYAFKWNEIAIALQLPEAVIAGYRTQHSSVTSKLHGILLAWIDLKGCRPTLQALTDALRSEFVGVPMAADLLEESSSKYIPLEVKRVRGSLELLFQSCDTEVAEGKSTLLQVQANFGRNASYQWKKDGLCLFEGAYFSYTASSLLYIHRANGCIEGKYTCSVSLDCEVVCCDEINVKVLYPPEKERLMNLYSLTNELPHDSWPPVNNPTFINLALIEKKSKSTRNYYTVRGDLDDILNINRAVEYMEVFKEYREGSLILVEGRPGSGKTTLLHKVTRDWARGREVLQGARMVFLLTMKFIRVSGKDTSLFDLLQIFYGVVLSRQVTFELTECGGKGACFILDGLDEYESSKERKEVIFKLIDQSFLPLSMVIVASRPVATHEIKSRCSRYIEVLGFSKEQLFAYIDAYGLTEESFSELKQYLVQHPNILNVCYLPAHVSMICFLTTKLGNVPSTETKICEQFVLATLLRHQFRLDSEVTIYSLHDLNSELKYNFIRICELAFYMVCHSKQVVSKKDSPLLFTDSLGLGLLTVEQTNMHYGLEHLYTFSHIIIQEYLAGFYLSQCDMERVGTVISSYSMDSMRNVWKFYCGQVVANINMLMRTDALKNLKDLLYNIICAFESQQKSFCDYVIGNGTLCFEEKIISSHEFMAISYVISNTSKPVSKLSFTNCKWDSEGVKALSIVEKPIESLIVHQFKDVGEYPDALNGMLCQLPYLKELNILDYVLNKTQILSLTRKITLPQLQVLKMTMPQVYCSSPEQVLKLLTFGSSKMTRVFIAPPFNSPSNTWKQCVKYVLGSKVLQHNWLYLYNSELLSLHHEQLSGCSDVVLVNCGIDDKGARLLVSQVNTSILKHLVLDFNRISDSGAVALANCLSKCSVIQEVSIQCNSIGDSGAVALADALVHCRTLTKLDLQGNSLGDEGAIAIAKCAENLSSLHLYLHNKNISEECMGEVLKHKTNISIRKMEFALSWNIVSEEDVDTLKNALYCENLSTFKLSLANISNIENLVKVDQGTVKRIECGRMVDEMIPTFHRIIACLKNLDHIQCDIGKLLTSDAILSTIRAARMSLHSVVLHGTMQSDLFAALSSIQLFTLELSDCGINSEDIAILFRIRNNWANLRTLNLSYNKIGSDGAITIAQVLQYCNNLRCLNLSYNVIGDSGAVGIVEELKNCTQLVELRLGYNGISSFVIFSQLLKCNNLRYLDLSDCGISHYEVPLLVETISNSLQVLNVGNNLIGHEGIVCLGERLQRFQPLRLVELHINNNAIGCDGVKFLANAPGCMENLQKLNLSGNEISSAGLQALIVIMGTTRFLRELDLAGNKFSIGDAMELVTGWSHCNMLTIKLCGCLNGSHESALVDAEKCCDSCDEFLHMYSRKDYVLVLLYKRYKVHCLPKMVSITSN